jgi:Tfp pilus assembly protein PilO
MFKTLQQQISLQMLLIVMALLMLLTVTAAYLYVFKKNFSDYKQSQQTVALLQDEINTGVSLPEQVLATQNAVQKLQQQLLGSAPDMPLNQKVSFVVGHLDSISNAHQVKLIGVKPGEISKVAMFQELPFYVEISGGYFSLFDWLQHTERELEPIIVKDFALHAQENGTIQMKMTLVSYLFSPEQKP